LRRISVMRASGDEERKRQQADEKRGLRRAS
jgi:hypothetical protein